MRPRTPWLYLVSLIGLLLTAPGCPVLLIGAGVAGGYAISNDTATVTLERKFDAVWAATLEEVRKLATVTEENKTAGTLEAKTPDGTRLWVALTRPADSSVSLTIKARKNMLPKPKAAQKLMEKVLKRF